MTAVIRSSVKADLSAIAAIYAHFVAHSCATFEEVAPTADEMGARRTAILALGLPFLVAEQSGIVVGYAYCNQYRPRSAYRFTIEDSIYVAPDHHGQGIGRQLLAELVRFVEAGPWQQMVAVIGDSANTSSIRLHERLGFQQVGTLERVGFKHGRWVDTVLMQRSLSR